MNHVRWLSILLYPLGCFRLGKQCTMEEEVGMNNRVQIINSSLDWKAEISSNGFLSVYKVP